MFDFLYQVQKLNDTAALEIVHYMRSRAKRKLGDVVLKLNISKTYDKIDRNYLQGFMLKIGFSCQWIIICVEIVN